jgi:hypothetical protein
MGGVTARRLAFGTVIGQGTAMRFLHPHHFIVIVVGHDFEHLFRAGPKAGPINGTINAFVGINADVVLA